MNCLPHPLTIGKWQRSVEYTSSGIHEVALEAIRRKVNDEQQWTK